MPEARWGHQGLGRLTEGPGPGYPAWGGGTQGQGKPVPHGLPTSDQLLADTHTRVAVTLWPQLSPMTWYSGPFFPAAAKGHPAILPPAPSDTLSQHWLLWSPGDQTAFRKPAYTEGMESSLKPDPAGGKT